jgi:YD repeat-containing protein
VTQYQYDAAGQVIAVIDPLGQTATYSYDNLGRKIGMTLPDPDGGGPLVAPQYTYAYDDAGNLASETDPEGHTTQYEYDALGQLLRVVDANGDATDYVYDAAGNMLSLTDPVGNTTTWVYDELDRVIQETNQLGDSRYYAYDDAGNLARYTDRNGRVTEYDYDALHRLIEERWLDGQTVLRTIDYAYDAAGHRRRHPPAPNRPPRHRPRPGRIRPVDLYGGEGFHAAICDGSVRFFSSSIDPKILRKLFTRAGEEVISNSDF